MSYEEQIWNSNNKIRTTWKIINRELHKKSSKDTIETLCIEGNMINNQHTIVEAFNKYFTTIADSIHDNIKVEKNTLPLA